MKKYILLSLLSFVIINCSKTSDQDYLDQATKFVEENKARKILVEALNSFDKTILSNSGSLSE